MLRFLLPIGRTERASSESAGRRVLLIVLLTAAMALRLVACFWWQARLPEETTFGFGDSESYWVLAQTIVRAEAYQFGEDEARVFRTPGYPLLLAGMFYVLGDDPPVMWARALSALLGTLAVAMVAWLAWELFNPSSAVVAAAIAAFYPGAIASSALVLSEAPFCPLMLLQLVLWTKAWNCEHGKGRTSLGLCGGVVAGVATLVRPSWLLFTPLAVLVGVCLGRNRKQHAIIGALMLAGLAVAMTPWWIRNAAVAGRFVPTTLQVGASLYDGLNPAATGASDMRFVRDFRWDQRQADAVDPPPRGLFEDRLDRRMQGAATNWARANPGRVVQLMGVKLVRMWNIWPNESRLRSGWIRLAVMIGFVPVLGCGVLGLWRFADRGWLYVLCVMPAVYLTLLHMVFVSSIRYRQPAMLAIIVLAAGALAAWPQDQTPRENTDNSET